MTEAPSFVDICEQFVETRISERCKHHIQRVQDIQEGHWHPNWRTAEAAIKIANEAMFQASPDVAHQFYFYIHYEGEYKSDNYAVDSNPEPQEEE